jgi:hypothetical protein
MNRRYKSLENSNPESKNKCAGEEEKPLVLKRFAGKLKRSFK